MLAADVEEQRALRFGELVSTATVGAWPGLERDETTSPVSVIPALQRRRCDTPGEPTAGCTEPYLGDLAQRSGELAAQELAMREGADDLGAKQSNRLGVIARAK
jgi:hypothetical protein